MLDKFKNERQFANNYARGLLQNLCYDLPPKAIYIDYASIDDGDYISVRHHTFSVK